MKENANLFQSPIHPPGKWHPTFNTISFLLIRKFGFFFKFSSFHFSAFRFTPQINFDYAKCFRHRHHRIQLCDPFTRMTTSSAANITADVPNKNKYQKRKRPIIRQKNQLTLILPDPIGPSHHTNARRQHFLPFFCSYSHTLLRFRQIWRRRLRVVVWMTVVCLKFPRPLLADSKTRRSYPPCRHFAFFSSSPDESMADDTVLFAVPIMVRWAPGFTLAQFLGSTPLVSSPPAVVSYSVFC